MLQNEEIPSMNWKTLEPDNIGSPCFGMFPPLLLLALISVTKGNLHNICGLRQNYCLFDGRHTRNIFSWYDDWLIFFNDPHTQKTRYGSPLLCRGGQQLSFHTWKCALMHKKGDRVVYLDIVQHWLYYVVNFSSFQSKH